MGVFSRPVSLHPQIGCPACNVGLGQKASQRVPADHGVCYADALQVQRALDWAETTPRTPQILRNLAASSRAIDGLCRRTFYPVIATYYWDWPNAQNAPPWRLWLDDHTLVSATAITTGTTAIGTSDYYLKPEWGPPYSWVELNRSTVGGWTTNATSPQRTIGITGTWGYDTQEDAYGTLATSVSSTTATSITVTDSSTLGPGALLRIDTERMLCTDRTMITTGLTVGGTGLTAAASATALTVSGAGLVNGETILIDSERMLITDLVGTAATVKRAADATALAAHSASAAIYAPRSLTVRRGTLGTTAATHSSGTVVYRHTFPDLITQLCVDETLGRLARELASFSLSGAREALQRLDAQAIADLQDEVFSTYGRVARHRAV